MHCLHEAGMREPRVRDPRREELVVTVGATATARHCVSIAHTFIYTYTRVEIKLLGFSSEKKFSPLLYLDFCTCSLITIRYVYIVAILYASLRNVRLHEDLLKRNGEEGKRCEEVFVDTFGMSFSSFSERGSRLVKDVRASMQGPRGGDLRRISHGLRTLV